MSDFKFTHNQDMSELEIADMFVSAKHYGLVDTVFYDGLVTTWQEWIAYLKHDHAWVMKMEHKDYGFFGFWWLNNFSGRSAMSHFCQWQFGAEGAAAACMAGIEWLKAVSKFQGLYGVSPKPYRHVVKPMEMAGFEIQGFIPKCCYLKRYDKYVDGRIFTIDFSRRGE